MTLNSDILTSNLDLPPPRFSTSESSSPIPDLIELQQPADGSTDSEIDSETLSFGRNGSPGASSAASDSPTPTNSVQDRSWLVFGVMSDEQRQLLGTEEESSDRHSSEEDTEVSNEVWTITPEQKEYYKTQFLGLQSDLNALIPGNVARNFFEKSRLPVHELRKIWQLADVTKDGALSLQEFNTAMHLVVLRRNHIELPDVLPVQLIPGNETPLSVTPETEPILSPQTKDTAREWTKFVDSPTSSVSSPGPKPVNFDFQRGAVEKDPKILHPVALRLTPEGQFQMNEENAEGNSPKKFLEIQNNSNVANSVANNVMNNVMNNVIQRPQPKKINIPIVGAIPPPPITNQPHQEEGPVSLPAFPPPKKEKPPPPPPRPFKSHGRSSSLDLNKLNKNLAPPSVPPRISPNIQSKKLINQKSEGDSTNLPTEHFANFDDFEKYENVQEEGIFPGDQYEAERKKLFAQFSVPETSTTTNSSNLDIPDQPPRKHGAFEIYRKPTPKNESPSDEEKQKFELFKKLQEQNTVLLRLCQELSQELADVREEKLALKVRLEKQLNGG
ncbi:ralBP1-associated Eps domain-containing protein 1 isoform X2 [Onthophagus taurus]|nr:ralBP1-associated Eps domain-containing protein 1 isoform X2 [Onthophagus taurus]